MLMPLGVTIDGASGAVTPETARYTKRLSDMRGLYRDAAALERDLAERGDQAVYTVIEHKQDGSDIFFGTTTMEPGTVGDEYFMTRGHFHQRRDMGEVYYTQSGEGKLLLQSRAGEVSVVDMKPGVCAFIPPDWAHRSINTGAGKLVFVWVCNPNAGHDYADIAQRGMRKLVVSRNGTAAIIDNPILPSEPMTAKASRSLNVGVLGCGPIAQAAHFESAIKARNVTLHAICDLAPDLLARMAATHEPKRSYADYEKMLADPELDAVIVATSDAFHVSAAEMALSAGKHVLCEKPLGMTIEEVERLGQAVTASGKVLQVGHMKRFDPGLQSAKEFIDDGMGQMLALKAWYCDSTHRYPVTDAVQPTMVRSANARKPAVNPKADLKRYFMLAHGCHLLDEARWLGGEIVEVEARLSEKFGAYCWFVDVAFANGTLGHLDLTIAVRMDWHEGLQIYGEHGSIVAKTYNPWYFRSSEVDIFEEKTGGSRRILGADAHFYRRQLEGFADVILEGKPMTGADVTDGIASVRAMVAVARSAASGKPVKLADTAGAV